MTINYRDQIEKDVRNSFNVSNEHKNKTFDEIRAVAEKQSLDYSVCLLNFTGDLNIGVCIRAASIFGTRRVILLGRREYDTRSTVGGQNYLDFIRIAALDDQGNIDIDIFWKTMDLFNLYPVLVEQGGRNIEQEDVFTSIDTLASNRNLQPCFVFGNESFGIPQAIIDSAPHRAMMISITQRGVLRSLNVSSAASIILHAYMAHKLK